MIQLSHTKFGRSNVYDFSIKDQDQPREHSTKVDSIAISRTIFSDRLSNCPQWNGFPSHLQYGVENMALH